MKVHDRRVQRTLQNLGAAMVALTLERGYDNVTIRDLTDRAGVGYATFFRHYADKEALLRDLLEEVLDGLVTRLEPLSVDADAAATGALVFQHVRANADLYRVLLGSQGSVDLLGRALEVGTASLLRTLDRRPGSIVPLELAAYHVVRSFVALIEWWLAHGLKPAPQVMGRIYQELILDPSRQAALTPKNEAPTSLAP